MTETDTPPRGPVATAVIVFLIGALTSLCGDACHIASGTTRYLGDGVPMVWRSAVWFPLVVGVSIVGAAASGRRSGLPHRHRTLADLVLAVGAVLAFYALTAMLRGQPTVVAVTLCASIAVAIWAWWDPSPEALAVAAGASVLGPVGEIGLVRAGLVSYAPGSDGLMGVAPWLPCLYFAAGAVASGLWKVVGGAAVSPGRASR